MNKRNSTRKAVSNKNEDSVQKLKILRKAGELFWRKGYAGTSMRDIADACGFEPPNIYNYFPNKESILTQIILLPGEQLAIELRQQIKENTSNPVEKLHNFIKLHLRFIISERNSGLKIVDHEVVHLNKAARADYLALRDEYDKALQKILSDGVEQGFFTPMDIKITGFAITSVIIRSAIWFSPKGRLTWEEIADEIFGIFINGISNKNK